jgi:hypothetical protein
MAACCQEMFLISQEIFKEKQDIKNEAWEISKISTTSYPGLLRLLLSEINKRRSPGYEVEISIKVILGTRCIKVTNITIRA